MKKTHIGKGLLILFLVAICVFGFISPGKADTANAAKSIKSVKSQLVEPGDMVQGGYYLLWDHGSGVSVVQYDRTENGNIYSTYAMKPAQASFTQNSSCTIYDAGDIELAGLLDILHLLRCIVAGIYVP